ncbi:hypothetical protein CNR22_11500 [Sphingobacteriaceae bacterium]|nr:hypothetical protein CNR22_11500 [Sphingobacteriaceae bacterium]
MEKQSYKNHIRWYVNHHFIFYPAVSLLTTASIVLAFKDPHNHFLWIAFSFVFILIALLSLMLRQHYALINQNRTVRLELRFRYYVLTHKRFEEVENKLSKSQVYALRFASDEELPGLVTRALQENLSGDQIKRSIKNWLPDDMRV